MLLLSEQQIDRVIRYRRSFMFFGLTTMALPMILPQGWAFGLFSGFMLFSLGVYGASFRKWRTESGIWMLAVFLTALLGPCWLYFEVLHWRGFWVRPAARPINVKFAIDAIVALLIFAHIVKLTLSVAIENWNRTRIVKQIADRQTNKLADDE